MMLPQNQLDSRIQQARREARLRQTRRRARREALRAHGPAPQVARQHMISAARGRLPAQHSDVASSNPQAFFDKYIRAAVDADDVAQRSSAKRVSIGSLPGKNPDFIVHEGAASCSLD